MMKYKLSIQLHKHFNYLKQGETWMDLNFQQSFAQRNENISVIAISTHKKGRNNLINRLNVVNGNIKYDWLNLSNDSFKIKCKSTFLNS